MTQAWQWSIPHFTYGNRKIMPSPSAFTVIVTKETECNSVILCHKLIQYVTMASILLLLPLTCLQFWYVPSTIFRLNFEIIFDFQLFFISYDFNVKFISYDKLVRFSNQRLPQCVDSASEHGEFLTLFLII